MAYTTIDDPSAHFQTVLWTGNSTDNRSITNDGNSDLQPDWVWIKNRNSSQNHYAYDSTRGVNVQLLPHDTPAESTVADRLQAFESDGFQVGASSEVNYNNYTYVGWQWKANGGTTTTNSAGANGADHESVYQADDTAGFSIVTYTSDNQSGDTIIKHGLSTAPTFMIHKARNADALWWVYHKDLTNDGYVQLDDTTSNQDGSTNVWRNTAPTSTVFKVGLDSIAAANGRTMVAYCFAPIQGYSKFGSYTGNGSEDGPFVYLGFKPQWILFKNTGAAEEWVLQDTTRNPNNPVTKNIRVDSSIAEADASSIDIDFLSNGFKNRSDQAQVNSSGVTYIYMAFAEHPFVSSKGVPTTAR